MPYERPPAEEHQEGEEEEEPEDDEDTLSCGFTAFETLTELQTPVPLIYGKRLVPR